MEKPLGNNEFVMERYESAIRRKEMVEWNYRDDRGKLHTGVAETTEQAIQQAIKCGLRPGAVITSNRTLSEQERRELEEAWKAQWRGFPAEPTKPQD